MINLTALFVQEALRIGFTILFRRICFLNNFGATNYYYVGVANAISLYIIPRLFCRSSRNNSNWRDSSRAATKSKYTLFIYSLVKQLGEHDFPSSFSNTIKIKWSPRHLSIDCRISTLYTGTYLTHK